MKLLLISSSQSNIILVPRLTFSVRNVSHRWRIHPLENEREQAANRRTCGQQHKKAVEKVECIKWKQGS